MGWFFGGLCIVLWALIPVVAKLGQSDLDSHQFLFFSSLISFLCLLGLGLKTGSIKSLRSYRMVDGLSAIGLGLMGTYLYYLFLYQGYAVGNGVEVLIVQYTWPIMISLLAPKLLGESFTIAKTLGLVLGFSAIVLMVSKGQWGAIDLDEPVALIWVAVGSLCFALFSVLSKRVTLEPISLITVYFGVATVASGLGMLFYSEFRWPSASSALPLILNGVLVNGFSYWFWLEALRRVNASLLAPFIFVTPLLSAAYLWLGFAEPFLDVYWLALALIVVSGLVSSLPFGARPKAA